MYYNLSILAALGAMLAWGFGDFFIQKVVRKVGDLEALAYIGVIGSIGLLPFVLPQINLILSKQNLILLISLGIITFLTALLNFEALKKGKLSVIEVILEIELPITIVLGVVFFKETITLIQLAIISLIFLGLLLVAFKSHHWKNFFKNLEKGVLIAIVAAIGLGLMNVLTGTSSKQISPIIAIWFPAVIFTLFCLIFIIKRNNLRKFIHHSFKYKYTILSMSILDTLAWLLFAFALVENKISITTAITESYPAIALFLGLWFNKEKIDWHQYLGAFLALISSVALALLI